MHNKKRAAILLAAFNPLPISYFLLTNIYAGLTYAISGDLLAPDIRRCLHFAEISNQIVNEPVGVYKMRAEQFDEEEVFVRGGVFKKEIPRIYNHTRSISGMRIITGYSIQMIDACHIIPFSESHDDTISNGISLCPNLHRAFDRLLITLDEDYRVVTKPFVEDDSLYSIKQFEGKQILLPENIKHYPSQDYLESHRKRFRYSLSC